jgi:hypothetical protein
MLQTWATLNTTADWGFIVPRSNVTWLIKGRFGKVNVHYSVRQFVPSSAFHVRFRYLKCVKRNDRCTCIHTAEPYDLNMTLVVIPTQQHLTAFENKYNFLKRTTATVETRYIHRFVAKTTAEHHHWR